MPNLNYAEQWSPELLAILIQGTLTSPFITNNVRWLDAKTFHFTQMSVSGYKNHKRSGGWNTGEYNQKDVPYTVTHDRDVQFMVDKADVDETNQTASIQNISHIFEQTQVVPETDALFFSKVAQAAQKTELYHTETASTEYTSENVFAKLKHILAAGKLRRYKANGSLITYVSSDIMDKLEVSKEFTRSYETSSSSEEYLQLGSAVSAKIEFSIKRIDELFENTEIPIEIGLKLPSGKYEYIPVGFFTAEHPTNDQATTTFTAYDRMMKTTGLYVSNLTYPASAVSVLNEISADCGVPVDVSNIDSSIMISTKPAGYTYREMIGYIASMAGGFACVDRTGTIVIKWYSDVDYKLDVTRIMSFEKDESNYNLEKLSCNVDNSTTLTSGGGILGVTFDNPFMTQDRLDNIFKKLSGFSYRGASVKTLGDVRLDPWDMITVEDGEDAYKVPVMNIQQEYDGGLAMTITSYGKTQTEQEVDFKGPTTQQNKRIYSDLILAKELITKKVDAEWVKANTVQAETIVSINNDLENIRNNYLKSNVAEITYATIESLKSLSGEFADLKATDFEAIKASVKDLNVDVEKVNTLLFGSATGTTITTDFANSVVSVIGDAQITSAMIKELAFDKLTGIDINTTVMNVHSEDGKSIWKDNTIQIRDKDRVRIQLGKDAAGDYNIYIWDKNGNLMFDPLYGIQESGIKKAIIRNDMVSDNAAISGKKLDIDSVFSVMNADKSNTFNASKIHVDTTDQTLESTFQTINNYVSGGSEAWGSTMLQSKTFIEHKLWWTDIDEEGNSVKSKFNDVKTTLDSFKIDMSDVTKQLSGTFEIYDVTGAPNLDNYPATEFFVPVYPAEDWYPLETDTWQYTQEEYAKHAGAIACMKSAGRYWKFLRQSNGKYGWTEISSSETAYMLNKHTAFQVAIDGITSEVSKVKVDIRDNYSTTTQMISRIVQEIKDDKSTISSSLQATYATQKYADDAANAATSGANNYTDNVLKTYSTTADIIQAISPGKTSISAAVTAKLGDYATSASLEAYIKKDPTTGELKSAIEAIADDITLSAKGSINIKGNKKVSISGDSFSLTSTNTTISEAGDIVCHNFIADFGKIGSWSISESKLGTVYSPDDNKLYMIDLRVPDDITPYVMSVIPGTKTEGYSKQPNYYLSPTGYLYAKNADIGGTIRATLGSVAGWSISSSLHTTKNGYIPPNIKQLNAVRTAINNNSTGSLDKSLYDFNGDGAIDLIDFVKIKRLMAGLEEFNTSTSPIAKASSITAKIDPSNASRIIDISATDMWGYLRHTYLGIDGLKTEKVVVTFGDTNSTAETKTIIYPDRIEFTKNGNSTCRIESDGNNINIYNPNGQRVSFQSDGNLVTYDSSGTAYWASGTP